FRAQVRAFLDATPLAGLPAHGAEFRQQCLRELRTARQQGLLTRGSLAPRALAEQVGAFARFADPQGLAAAETQAVAGLGDEFRAAGYPTLAHFVALQPAQGTPVLVAAVRYFFRRQVETDRELFQGLSWANLAMLAQAQDQGLRALGEALTEHGQRLEGLLAEVQQVVVQTHGAVLDVQAEQQRQGQQLQELYQIVLDVKRRHDLATSEVRPRDSLAIGS